MDTLYLELPLPRCPHCGRADPLLVRVWNNDGKPLPRADGGKAWYWSAFACRSCSGVVTVRGKQTEAKNFSGVGVHGLVPDAMFPEAMHVDDTVPSEAARYMKQALETQHAPDACVLMCAASIDAMLKDKGLKTGSLFARLEEALTQQLIPKALSDWSHWGRLDANGSRHADEAASPLSDEDAERSIGFARAMAEYLYVLPAKMPAKRASEAGTKPVS